MRWDISRESAQLGEDDSENLHPDCFLSVPDMIRIELKIVFKGLFSHFFSNFQIYEPKIELTNTLVMKLQLRPMTDFCLVFIEFQMMDPRFYYSMVYSLTRLIGSLRGQNML